MVITHAAVRTVDGVVVHGQHDLAPAQRAELQLGGALDAEAPANWEAIVVRQDRAYGSVDLGRHVCTFYKQ